MNTNTQGKRKLTVATVAMAVMLAGTGAATAQDSYRLVRIPDIESAVAITDSGVILAYQSYAEPVLLEPVRDAAGNPVWDSDGDEIADGYTVTVLNPGGYWHFFVDGIDESLDVVGSGRPLASTNMRFPLLWANAPEGNPPVELGRTFDYDYGTNMQFDSRATGINDLGQVLVSEWAADWADGDPYNFTDRHALSLVNPKDTDGDGSPDLWFEDLDGDGYNDLMRNLEFVARELAWGSPRFGGRINNYGEVAGKFERGFVILPEDTDGDGEPDLWFEDLDGDGRNDLPIDLGPAVEYLHISDSGGVVGSQIREEYYHRWQIDESGNVDLVASESKKCWMRGVNNLGQAVGYTAQSMGQMKSKHTTLLWEPDLAIRNLYRLLDNAEASADSLRCSDINDARCIVGDVTDNYPEESTYAFVAVPIAVNAPPEALITSPADGATFDSGAVIDFSGTAFDAEDGDLTAALIWTSSIDGQIGTGGGFSASLSDGIHTITASATDSGGATGSDSIGITVGTVAPGVTVASITPDTIQAGATIDVVITGSGFQAGATVSFEGGAGVAPTASVTYVDGTTIEATVSAHKNAKPGAWDVRVTNPDGSSGVLIDGLTVVP